MISSSIRFLACVQAECNRKPTGIEPLPSAISYTIKRERTDPGEPYRPPKGGERPGFVRCEDELNNQHSRYRIRARHREVLSHATGGMCRTTSGDSGPSMVHSCPLGQRFLGVQPHCQTVCNHQPRCHDDGRLASGGEESLTSSVRRLSKVTVSLTIYRTRALHLRRQIGQRLTTPESTRPSRVGDGLRDTSRVWGAACVVACDIAQDLLGYYGVRTF